MSRSATATRNPFEASARQIAAPIPPAPPVTSATPDPIDFDSFMLRAARDASEDRGLPRPGCPPHGPRITRNRTGPTILHKRESRIAAAALAARAVQFQALTRRVERRGRTREIHYPERGANPFARRCPGKATVGEIWRFLRA